MKQDDYIVFNLSDFLFLYRGMSLIYIEKKYKDYQEQFVSKDINPFFGFFDIETIEKIEEMR